MTTYTAPTFPAGERYDSDYEARAYHEERMARLTADRERDRRRHTTAVVATIAAIVAIAIAGTWLLIDGPSPATPQAPAAPAVTHTMPLAPLHPAQTIPVTPVHPATPNPDVPSGNNIGNMGTGGGPTS